MIDFGAYNGYIWPCFIASGAVLCAMVIEAVVNLRKARRL